MQSVSFQSPDLIASVERVRSTKRHGAPRSYLTNPNDIECRRAASDSEITYIARLLPLCDLPS
jgi:hypothetical protein